jgi:hypothetical protein
MDELYRMMKAKLEELYDSQDGCVMLDYVLFFKLYKLVCDMMQIRAVVKQNDD